MSWVSFSAKKYYKSTWIMRNLQMTQTLVKDHLKLQKSITVLVSEFSHLPAPWQTPPQRHGSAEHSLVKNKQNTNYSRLQTKHPWKWKSHRQQSCGVIFGPFYIPKVHIFPPLTKNPRNINRLGWPKFGGLAKGPWLPWLKAAMDICSKFLPVFFVS